MAEGRGAGGGRRVAGDGGARACARPARWSPFPCNRVKVATIVATRVQKRALTSAESFAYISGLCATAVALFFAPSKFSRRLPFLGRARL